MFVLQILAVFIIAFAFEGIFSHVTRSISGFWGDALLVASMVVVMLVFFAGLSTFAYDIPGLPMLFVVAFLGAIAGTWFGVVGIPLLDRLIADWRLRADVVLPERRPIMGSTDGTQSHG